MNRFKRARLQNEAEILYFSNLQKTKFYDGFGLLAYRFLIKKSDPSKMDHFFLAKNTYLFIEIRAIG